MRKAEQNTPFNPVEIEELPNGKTRVLLRENISEETRRDEGGGEYTVYTADETELVTEEKITQEYASEHFDELVYIAENGETQKDKYARLVDEYIREKYPQSAVEAIINNYLSDPQSESAIKEFNALQEYRSECKERAKEEV